MTSMTDPKISVLIPAYNEELVIEGTIKALVAADCNLKDIYVVDDRSTDKTAEIARKSGVNVYTVPVNGGKARAQVAALEYFGLCEGPIAYDWVIFLDGDSKVDKQFFAKMKAAAVDDSNSLYVGQIKSVRNSHVFSAARAAEYAFGHDFIKQGQDNFGVIFVSPGCASMYNAKVLRHLKIDHKTLAEDMDLTMQVHRYGGKVKYVNDAIVHTQDPKSLKDYYKQILRWNRGFWQVVIKHRVFGLCKKQRVDWYMMFITADALLTNRVVWFLGIGTIFSWNPLTLLGGLLIDFGVSLLVALYAAWKTKRLDVLTKLPLYFWLRPLADFVNIKSFVEIVLLRKELLAWNKVARYEFNNHLSKELK